MPCFTTSPNGFKISFALPKSVKQAQIKRNTAGTTRGKCSGWSPAALRRNADVLRSIDIDAMSLSSIWGATLTMRDAPPSPEDYKRRLHIFFKRLHREGFLNRHYVTEWAQIGRFGGSAVPHLHLTIFEDQGLLSGRDLWDVRKTILFHWRDVFLDLGISLQAQHVEPVCQFRGWAAYCAKHAARAAGHVQRDTEILPDGWEKSGRMWGISRSVIRRHDLIEIPESVAFVFRRIVLAYLLSVERDRMRRQDCPVRRKQIKKRQIYLKRYLQRPLENSQRLPISEFISEDLHQEMLAQSFVVSYNKPLSHEKGA